MQRESKKYLQDVLNAATSIEEFTRNRTLSDMESDDLLRSGVYYQFVIIGEALSQTRRIDEELFDRISPSSRIVGFRIQIGHGCQVIPDKLTWQVIREKLPILRGEVQQLLSE
jgi:uncharacterized protein with HEPN domain